LLDSPKHDLFKCRVLIYRPETQPAAQVVLLSPHDVRLQEKKRNTVREREARARGRRPDRVHENNCLSEYNRMVQMASMLHRVDAAAWPNPYPSPPRLRAYFHNHAFVHVFSALLLIVFYVSSCSFWSIRRPAPPCAAPPISFRRKEARIGWIRSCDAVTQGPAHTECAPCSHFGGSALICATCRTVSETNVCKRLGLVSLSNSCRM
jgi:hypothetical protein